MKNKRVLGVILLALSIILFIVLGIAIGFYNQILSTGFNPNALFLFTGLITVGGIIGGIAMINDI